MRAMESASSTFEGRFAEKLRAYFDLTKPRIALLVLMVAIASFYLAAPRSLNWGKLLLTVIGTSLLAGGIFALNHYYERDVDSLMKRTDKRPLPSGRLSPAEAMWFGLLLTIGSIVLIAAALGWLAGAIAVFTFVSYVYVYTPLKRRTPYHTALGALPGAMPPLLGWAAARGTLDLDAVVLFGVMFFWQFPHFLAIEMMYSEDYAKAGIRVLPVVEPTWRASGIQVVVTLTLLLGVTIVPFLTGLADAVYLVGAVLLGGAFLAAGIAALGRKERKSARLLLLASVFYLPVLFGLMMLDVR